MNNYKEEFNEWFFETWEKTGGLIQPATGAELLGITRQSINGMIKFGRLKKYSYKNKTFIGLNDIALLKMKKENLYKRKNKKITIQTG